MPYRKHLSSPADLVTTYEEVRGGFVALALERSRRAVPYIEEARSLQVAASSAKDPRALLKIKGIRLALLTASGVSDKAAGHMEDADKEEAINGLVTTFLEPAGPAFVEELVFRFLLTRGDTLGGSMRNVAGILGQRKLTRAIIAALSIGGTKFVWLNSLTNKGVPGSADDPDIEFSLKALSWQHGVRPRTLVYNITVQTVKSNIDIVLLACKPDELSAKLKDPESYIVLGELKGGIDPAGADEHWKTATAALDRIRTAFASKKLTPFTFFVGAAIAPRMADEIWSHLKNGSLTNAANLTGPNQVASLCQWLCSL